MSTRELSLDVETGSGWYAALARSGLVAKGVSYGLVGVLALELALGAGGKATSQQGALQTLARHSFGKAVLAALAFGFAAYAAWRFVQAVVEDDGEDGKRWAKRIVYAGRGIIYAGFTFSAAKILVGSGQQSQNGKAHQTTAAVLSWPGGTWLVAIVGLVFVGVGAGNAYQGVTRKFADSWTRGGRGERTWGCRIGVAGHVARGVVFALIGVFAVRAAVDYAPKQAVGLDGALQKLAHASYGPWLLGITAAGLVCYGVYCLVDARARDFST